MTEWKAGRWSFEKIGLGYRCWNDEIQTEFRLTKLRRSRGELTGDITIKANIKGVKAQDDGTLHRARLNTTSSTARASLAHLLEKRTPGQDMDWFDGLERLCQGVMQAEEEGEPTMEVGLGVPRPPEDKYLVEPLVLKGQTSLVYGPGGSGKSLIALACGLSVAVGREIMPDVPVRGHGNVLYLDWETEAAEINDRIQAIATGHGFKPGGVFYRQCRRPLADEVEKISEVVAEKQIVMVIVDSAAFAMGTQGEFGDSNESTIRMYGALRQFGVSNLVVDHVNRIDSRTKPGKASPYGSIYKDNSARNNWEIRKAAPNGTMKVGLYYHKGNNTRDRDPFGLEIDWVDERITFRRVSVMAPEEAERSLLTIKEQILELLDDNAKRLPDVIAKDLNLNPSSVRVKLRELFNAGLVKTDEGMYWKDRTVVNFRSSGDS